MIDEMLKDAFKCYEESKKELSIDAIEEFSEVRIILQENGIDTDNYDKNLKNLKFSTREYGNSHYDAKGNEIIVNKRGLNTIHELFHMASSYGEDNKFPTGIKEGIVELFASYSRNYNPNATSYGYEVEIARKLGKMAACNIYIDFFNDDYASFIEKFGDKKEIAIEVIKLLEEYEELFNSCYKKMREKNIKSFDDFKKLYDENVISKDDYVEIQKELDKISDITLKIESLIGGSRIY